MTLLGGENRRLRAGTIGIAALSWPEYDSSVRRNAMRLMVFVLLMIGLLAGAGCDGKGSAQGGGSENGNHGHVKLGIPF